MEALDLRRLDCGQASTTESTMSIFEAGPAAAPVIMAVLAYILVAL
jgi:hypothetical protein